MNLRLKHAVNDQAPLGKTFLLWLLVVCSALAVIYMTHLSRNAFVETQRLSKQADDYDVEWGRLLIERSSSSSISRIEGIATDQLGMAVPNANRVIVLQEDAK